MNLLLSVKKTYYLVIPGILCCCTGNLRKDISDSERERLKITDNKIISIIQWQTLYKFDSVQPSVIKNIKEFDPAGRIIKETRFKNNGEKENYDEFEYDDYGNEISMTGYDEHDSLIFKRLKVYDSNSNNIESTWLLPDGTYKYKTTSTYDSKGKLIELKYFWPDGRLKYYYTYDYTNGLKTATHGFNPDGSVGYDTYYDYDLQGNMISETQIYPYPDNKINFKKTYRYNNNLLVEETEYFSDDVVANRNLFIYDDDGNLLTKTSLNSTGEIIKKQTYKYDKKGLLVEQHIYNSKNKPVAFYEYNYDNYN